MEGVVNNTALNYEKIYKGKRVFLTGHTGFKGSWLLTWLHMLGAVVKGYSLTPDAQHKLYEQIDGNSLCDAEFADIMDYERMKNSLLEFQPDFVFHLAAQAIVRTSYEDPLTTFSVNAIGTANLLNAVRLLEKPCTVVLITTDKVYHNNEWHYPYRETDRLGGYDPYSASKACSEIVIDSYRNSFFNRSDFQRHNKSIVVARAGNVIGGGDWAKDRIVPDIVRALQAGETVELRNPNAVRPWQHVLEPLNAYLMLAAKVSENPGKYSSEFNFGPSAADCISVLELVKHAISVWGQGEYKILDNSSMPHEAGLLKLDTSRAYAELNWAPVFSARQAIEKTVNWYKEFDNNALHLLERDIALFSPSVHQ